MNIILLDIFVILVLYTDGEMVSSISLACMSIGGSLWIPLRGIMYRDIFLDNVVIILLIMRILHVILMLYLSIGKELCLSEYKLLYRGNVVEVCGYTTIVDRNTVCIPDDDYSPMFGRYRGFSILVYDEPLDRCVRLLGVTSKTADKHILLPFIQWVQNRPRYTLCKGSIIECYDNSMYASLRLDSDIHVLDATSCIIQFAEERYDIYGSIDIIVRYLTRSLRQMRIHQILPFSLNGIVHMDQQNVHVFYGCYREISNLSRVMVFSKYLYPDCKVLRVVSTSLPYVLSSGYKDVDRYTLYVKIPTNYSDICIM